MNGWENAFLLGGKQVVLPPNLARIIPSDPINKNTFYSLTDILQLQKETYNIQALNDLGTIMVGQTFLAQLFSNPAAYVYTNFVPVKGGIWL